MGGKKAGKAAKGGAAARATRPVGAGSGGGSNNLTGMAAVQHVFHFLHGPADVLRAATAGRRCAVLLRPPEAPASA